ncbi:hypothetical protein VTL71DRAFT_2632 [Oculimacula yallundae]|uniref:Nuclear RNA binding protein n=1 Tax=Oculimacula yallundae TaxID=86028 RepID=A0ABR4CAS7_9HELO
MASTHQVRGRSRNRSDERTTTTSVDSTPKPGTKRLFSNRESRQLASSENAELNTQTADGESHSDKRHRSSDWPLPNPNTNPSPSSASSRHRIHTHKTPQSPSSSSHRSRARSSVRPSKFVEGSMNDRVSQMPPVPYLEPEDEFLSEYNTAGCGEGGRGRKLTRSRIFTHHPNTSVAESSTNQSDASRSSSLFRFGKSIAASFNPTNWKFWSKEHEQQAEEEDEEAAQLRVLKERREKAERIYQELKESGHFRDSAVGPRLFAPASERKAGKHDSGIDFGDLDMSSSGRGSSSIEEKRNGRVFLEPPQSKYAQRGQSPASNYEGSVAQSNTSTPRNFTFKKPSLANLRRGSLSNIKSAFVGDSSTSVNDQQHQARRIPSRKDLHKQQKLVKRVSNLEERLKQARQQLAVALNEPLPSAPASASGTPTSQAPSRVSRNRFVPGALSSLPSERLLSGYVSSEAEDGEMGRGIGQAVSTDLGTGDMSYMSGGLEDLEENTPAAGASLYSQEDRQADNVMQSVEDDNLARLEPFASIEDTSHASGITPTKPKDTEMPLPDYEDEELTPKPKIKLNNQTEPIKALEPTKKRKSIFERIPDDGGAYNPSDDEEDNEDDLESDIVSEVSSLAKPKTLTKSKSTSTTTSRASSSRSKGPTLLLQHPRKLQKVVSGPKNTKVSGVKASDAKSSVSTATLPPPPTRTAPPPPPSASSASNHPTKPKTLQKSNTLKKTSLAPTSLGNRQQSASPPPSSATFTSPELKYTKPTRTHVLTPMKAALRKRDDVDVREEEEDEYEYEDGDAVPPMPPMPKAVRLASGEIVKTEGMVKPLKTKGKKVGAGKNEAGGSGGEKEGVGMSASVSKQSFEWPDDVF